MPGRRRGQGKSREQLPRGNRRDRRDDGEPASDRGARRNGVGDRAARSKVPASSFASSQMLFGLRDLTFGWREVTAFPHQTIRTYSWGWGLPVRQAGTPTMQFIVVEGFAVTTPGPCTGASATKSE